MSTFQGGHVVESGGHVVQLYFSDDELIGTLATYLADAIFAGGLAIALVTPEHRELLAERLVTTAGHAAAEGSVLLLDAQEQLDRFLVDGRPDPGQFEASVGELVRGACPAVDAAAHRRGPVHLYGEMVALLWAEGWVGAALELEELWNGLRRRYEFSLLCGYPARAVEGSGFARALDEVCRVHTSVLGMPELPAAGPGDTPAGTATEGRRVVPRRPSWRPTSLRPRQPPLVARRDFGADLGAPRAARAFVVVMLTEWHEEAFAGDAGLVVTELATNAVVHAGTTFSVTVTADPGSVRLAVEDESPVVPTRGEVLLPERAATGRGLNLVAALTRSWGVWPTRSGKVVWAELTDAGRPSSRGSAAGER